MTKANEYGLKRFAELVSAYGARPESWPEIERERAHALLAASSQARRIMAEAAQLDDWLDRLETPPDCTDLKARILAAAPVLAPSRPRHMTADERGLLATARRWRRRLAGEPWFAPVMRPIYVSAAAALFGLALGWAGTFNQGALAGEEEEILAMAFVGSELEIYDLGDMQ